MESLLEGRSVMYLNNIKNTDNSDNIDVIKIYLNDVEVRRKQREMLDGQAYYNSDNTAINHRIMQRYDVESEKFVDDNSTTNNKLSHGFMKILVDEKLNYLLTKPYSMTCDDKSYLENVKEVLGKNFQKKLSKCAKQASNKGIGWLYPYISNKGELKFSVFPSEEIIPLWVDEEHEELQAVIRVYDTEYYEDLMRKVVTKIEYYTDDGVEYYIKENGDIMLDAEAYILNGNSNGHYTVDGQDMSWGKVPFIAIKNNDEELADLHFVRSLIDSYDRARSDIDNELEDIRNAFYVLKGYIADQTESDKVVQALKYSRIISVDSDGDLDIKNTNIDIDSAKEHCESLKKDIVRFGQGLDKDTSNASGNTSGIALKFLYSSLDLKCNALEESIQSAFIEVLYFVNQYLSLINEYVSESEVELVFNRDIVINEADSIEMCANSKGIISDETILANHPWVTDTVAELERINEEENQYSAEISDMFPNTEEE